MSSSVFNTCVEEMGENATNLSLLECVANDLSQQETSFSYSRTVLLVFASALVFFMQAGFAM